MMGKTICLGLFCLLVLTACGSAPATVSSAPTEDTSTLPLSPTASPSAIINSPTPPRMFASATIPQTPTPTPMPVSPTPTVTPFTRSSFPIQPVNGPDKWELYNSPNSIRVLLFDGLSMWAGTEAGGLVQWEPQSLTAVRHTQASGFPLNTVNDLAYDAATGYLCAVGDAGLAIWDGRQWYQRTPAQLGFEPDLPLTAVAVEGGAVIWVGGEQVSVDHPWAGGTETYRGGGLAHGDWITNAWQHYTSEDGLPHDRISNLAIDQDGNVWVASGYNYGETMKSGGVTKITFAGEMHTDYLEDMRGAIMKGVDSVVTSNSGVIYIGAHFLFDLSPGSSAWTRHPILNQGPVVSDMPGQVWLVLEHDIISLPAQSSAAKEALSQPWLFAGQLSAALDNEGHLWYGGQTGLFELTGEQVHSRSIFSAPPQNKVFSVAINGDGSVWFRSSDEDGENKYVSRIVDRQITHFNHEELAIKAAYPWTGQESLWSVTPDGKMWYTDDRALWGYDGERWENMPFDAAMSGYISQPVAGPDGTLALLSRAGLSLYHPGTGWDQPTRPRHDMYWYTKLVFKGDDEIWLSSGGGLYGNGIALRYRISANLWDVFDPERGGVRDVSFRGISLSPRGDIWAASFAGILAVYHADGVWTQIVEKADLWGIAGFREVFFEPDGDVWITTLDWCGFEAVCIDGLVYYDGARWVRLAAENSGLIHNEVYDIAFDGDGNVWLATAAGLQRTAKP